MHPPIKAKFRISERSSYNMIIAMAMHGNHNKDIYRNIKTVANVEDHLSQNGMTLKAEINKCRDFKQHVPLYENLLGAQWTTNEASVSKVNHSTRKYQEIISGDGTFNEADYWVLFELAREDFETSIKTGRYERFLSAVNSGLAAIETFMNHQYLIRTGCDADDAELKNDIEKKVSEWVPMFSGKTYDKSKHEWAAFKKLKALRNEDFQHRKSVTSGITFRALVDLLNEFRYGICKVLMELHILFEHRCPTIIIRYAHYPEIELIKRT